MSKNISTPKSSNNENKDSELMPPPLPLVNKSNFGGISSSFNSFLSYKSFNLSKSLLSPIGTQTNTKIFSEDLSQTSSNNNNFYNTNYPIGNQSPLVLRQRKNSDITIKDENLSIYLCSTVNTINNNSINNNTVNLNHIYSNNNYGLIKKFIKKEIPNNDEEIKIFISNLLDYINILNCMPIDEYRKRNIISLKTKIEVRYIDYKNNGMQKEYFLESLMKMQNELIMLICKYNNNLIYDFNGNKLYNSENDKISEFFNLFQKI